MPFVRDMECDHTEGTLLSRTCTEQAKKSNLTSRYWQLNRDVRNSAKKEQKEFFNTLATEAESAAGQRNMKRLHDIARTMSEKEADIQLLHSLSLQIWET